MRRERSALAPLTQWGQVSGRLARRGFWPLAAIFFTLSVAALRWENLWLALVALVILWPLMAAAQRRLHDTNLSGAWVWLILVPGVNLVLVALLLRGPYQRPSIYDSDSERPVAAGMTAGLSLVAVLFACLATVVPVQQAGMKPGLLPGDWVMVWRRGGGGWSQASCWPVRCQFAQRAAPARGESIAIRTASGPKFARVIALPGDQVELRSGVVYLNAAPLPQQRIGMFTEPFGAQGPLRLLPRCGNGAVGLGAKCQTAAFAEGDYLVLGSGRSALDHLAPRIVPDETVFALVDHRDVPEDSRVTAAAGGLGLVDHRDIIGRPARVIISARGSSLWAIWSWRWARIWEPVR